VPVRPSVLLIIPTAGLVLLAWFGVALAGRAAGACADWARQYRDARNDLSTATAAWQAGHHLPERAEFQARVQSLGAARPPRCTVNGTLYR
jgi:hypothetical protein